MYCFASLVEIVLVERLFFSALQSGTMGALSPVTSNVINGNPQPYAFMYHCFRCCHPNTCMVYVLSVKQKLA